MAEQEKSRKRLINELQRRKNNYMVTYKKIKRLVEGAAGQKTFDDNTKDRFRAAALESNKSHKEFREFLLPFFSDCAIKDVFPEEALAEENDNLKSTVQELQRNKQVLDALVEELSEKCTALNEKVVEFDKLQETVTDLQMQIEEYKKQTFELKQDETPHKLVRKYSDSRNEQQDKLIRDLEHRLSFRQKGRPSCSRRERYIEQSLEKIYRINEDLEGISIIINESLTKSDCNFMHFRDMLIQNLIKLEDIASNGHLVVRSEKTVVIKKAQGLLDLLNTSPS